MSKASDTSYAGCKRRLFGSLYINTVERAAGKAVVVRKPPTDDLWIKHLEGVVSALVMSVQVLQLTAVHPHTQVVQPSALYSYGLGVHNYVASPHVYSNHQNENDDVVRMVLSETSFSFDLCERMPSFSG